jgi:hypothetical protein
VANVVPVDEATRFLVGILQSRHEDGRWSQPENHAEVFHMTSPAHTSLEALVESLDEQGFALRRIPWAQWEKTAQTQLERLRDTRQTRLAAFAFLCMARQLQHEREGALRKEACESTAWSAWSERPEWPGGSWRMGSMDLFLSTGLSFGSEKANACLRAQGEAPLRPLSASTRSLYVRSLLT